LLERRDPRQAGVLLRASAAGLVATLLAPIGAIGVKNVGSQGGAIRDLSGMSLEAIGGFLVGAGLVALLVPLWGVLLLVRARTARVAPQTVAAAFTGFLVAVLDALDHVGGGHDPRPFFALTIGGALGGAALALLERALGPRLDPRAPAPEERGAWLLLGVWAAPVLVASAVLLTVFDGHHHGGEETSAIGSLKRITTAQTMFAQSDKDRDGTENYAASLSELSDPNHGSLIDAELGSGTKYGYAFATTCDPAHPTERWCAIADPVPTWSHPSGTRRFWTNQAGQIYYASVESTPPLTLDPTAPGPPAGWVLVGH
jgi:hypothetical protein